MKTDGGWRRKNTGHGGRVKKAEAGGRAEKKRVCVVGAGPCGLTTIKQLLDEGHEVVCFDKNPDLGGIWVGTPVTAIRRRPSTT